MKLSLLAWKRAVWYISTSTSCIGDCSALTFATRCTPYNTAGIVHSIAQLYAAMVRYRQNDGLFVILEWDRRRSSE